MSDPKYYSDLIEFFKIKNFYANITENMQFIRGKSYASVPTTEQERIEVVYSVKCVRIFEKEV